MTVLITTDISIDDYKAYLRFVRKRPSKAVSSSSRLLREVGTFLLFVLMGLLFVFLMNIFDFEIHLPSVIGTLIIFFSAVYFSLFRAQRRLYPEKNGFILGQESYEIDDGGIVNRKSSYESLTKWTGIKSLEETDKHFFVFLDNIVAHIIPKRSFANDLHMQDFKKVAFEHLNKLS